MGMLALNWNSTPPEILRSICEYLDPSALRNLTAVNKQINLVASTLLFQAIHINVLSREQLRLDVDCLTQQLTRSACLESVHYLRVDGTLPREKDDDGKLRHEPVPPWQEEEARLVHLWNGHNHIGSDRNAQQILDEDNAWLPLARLIARLPALQDLVFACTNQFAPCLLEAVHQDRSIQCRLHLDTFCLRSYDNSEMQEYEHKLVTSPHLEGIATIYEVHARVALALAPTLKRLYLVVYPRYASIEDFTRAPTGVTTTANLNKFHNETKIRRRCPLTRLQLLHQRFDEEWDELVDLSTLRTLILTKPIEHSMLNRLAMKAPFRSLSELEVPISCWDEQHSRESYSQSFTSFIGGIAPLRSLNIWANPLTSNILAAILEQHGASLRRLSLAKFGHLKSVRFDADQVRELNRRCPSLRELEIKAPRSKGDFAEQAIYKALGSMPNLQQLRLKLDCENRTCVRTLANGEIEILNPSWDDYSQQSFPDEGGPLEINPRNGHVIDMLINCALDAKLAEEIFNCISSAKPPGAQRLDSLRLSIHGGAFFGEPNLPYPADANGVLEVVRRIEKAWMLERSDIGTLEVRELGGESDYYQGLNGLSSTRWMDREQEVLTAQVEPIVRKLWPGDGNWLHEWHSFPLEGVQRDN
ncbi:hypothetical protein IFR05_005306 [Cadophora sp. M221]|nr:hypothetical protein IFR05_005306 [Cadophora sp. M221]